MKILSEEFLQQENLIRAWIIHQGDESEYVLRHSAADVANFIGGHLNSETILITTLSGGAVAAMRGRFLKSVADEKFGAELIKHLVPIQMQHQSAVEVERYSAKEYAEYSGSTLPDISSFQNMHRMFYDSPLSMNPASIYITPEDCGAELYPYYLQAITACHAFEELWDDLYDRKLEGLVELEAQMHMNPESLAVAHVTEANISIPCVFVGSEENTAHFYLRHHCPEEGRTCTIYACDGEVLLGNGDQGNPIFRQTVDALKTGLRSKDKPARMPTFCKRNEDIRSRIELLQQINPQPQNPKMTML